jgi:hypothetical protein
MKNFKEVLKSLSDTELVAISKEVADPNITNDAIIGQLMSKANDPEFEYTPDIDIMFCIDMCIELGDRLLECDKRMSIDDKDSLVEEDEYIAAHKANEL